MGCLLLVFRWLSMEAVVYCFVCAVSGAGECLQWCLLLLPSSSHIKQLNGFLSFLLIILASSDL